MKTSDFSYELPPEFIAQSPIEPRDRSRLMVLNRGIDSIEHHTFFELVDYLKPGDVLVLNNSRVIPARLFGRWGDTGGRVELLLLNRLAPDIWEVLAKPGKRARTGTTIELEENENGKVTAEVIESRPDGAKVLAFSDEASVLKLGRIPLPPYIHRPLTDPGRYQTVYASSDGSVAAPTAGLHFTPGLLAKIRNMGVRCLFVTLHIGPGTFQPVREEDPSGHRLHQEYGYLAPDAADEISRAKEEGRRIICAGTTTTRILEQAALKNGPLQLKSFEGWVDLFILPGFRFRVVDALITNFHLPRSTLLMLVSAFAGRDFIKKAYQEAIAEKYRFYSFGDAMLIL